MGTVFSIIPLVWTSEDNDSETDGNVYMGIGGREFYLETPRDDFESGNAANAAVGKFSQVSHPEMNDPRKPLTLLTERLDLFPVFLRLDGDDHWKPWNALIHVISGPDEDHLSVTDWFVADIDSSLENGVLKGGLWLGPQAGRWLFLRRGGRGDLRRILRGDARLMKEADQQLARAGIKLSDY